LLESILVGLFSALSIASGYADTSELEEDDILNTIDLLSERTKFSKNCCVQASTAYRIAKVPIIKKYHINTQTAVSSTM